MDELDPAQRLQIDALAEEYSKRHGVAVEFLKDEIGPGEEFHNYVARAVISPNGAWFECIDLPMEFSGATGTHVRHRFISDADAVSLMATLYKITGQITGDNTVRFDLLAFYRRTGVVDNRQAYGYQLSRPEEAPGPRTRVIGKYREGVLPLFYRCRFDSEVAAKELGFKAGVVFCLANVGEKNLVVEIPYEGENLRDLAFPPANSLPH